MHQLRARVLLVALRLARWGSRLEATTSAAPPMPWTQQVGAVCSPTLVRAYALASGDNSAIHVDEGAARAAGLETQVAQGLLVLALATRAAVGLFGEGDHGRVRAVSGRFVAPVGVGDALAIRLGPLTRTGGNAVGMEVSAPAGVALRRGVVELGPA